MDAFSSKRPKSNKGDARYYAKPVEVDEVKNRYVSRRKSAISRRPRQVHPPKSYLLSHREEILYPCTSRLQKGKRQHRSKQRLKTDKTSSKLVAASTHPVKSNGIYSIKCMGTKLAATVEEKEESLQSKDKEHQIQQMSMRVDALVRERDAARYEMEKVIKQIECFHCFGHENDRHAFIPRGYMVCADCKEKYAMGTSCPKCQVKIIGHLQLFN